MTPFETYKLFLSLKRHFCSDYDFFKYQGKSNASLDSYEKRKDKYFFQKIAKKYPDPLLFLVSNLYNNPDLWVGSLLESRCEQNYKEFITQRDSLTYNLQNELKYLKENFNENFQVTKGLPPIIKLYQQKKISIFTLLALVKLTNCVKHWDAKLKDDLLYPQLRLQIVKLLPFIDIDLKKIKSLVKDHFS